MNQNYNEMPNGYLESIHKGIQTARTLSGRMSRGKGTKSEQLARLTEALHTADAIVIGAGAGLSTSAGMTYSGERFDKYFGDFASKYNFHDMYSGGFYPYPNAETRWAYWSRNIYINRYVLAPKPVYSQLLDLVKDKDYFVITTNVDHQFQKAGFDKERLFYTQGDYGLWQCSKPCHKRTYDNKERVVKMLLSQGFAIGENSALVAPTLENGATDFTKLSMQVPSGLVPYCPVCGEPMTMNLRADDTFVEDEGWRRASAAYGAARPRHTRSSCTSTKAKTSSTWSSVWAATRQSSSNIPSGRKQLLTTMHSMPASTTKRHTARKKSRPKVSASMEISELYSAKLRNNES